MALLKSFFQSIWLRSRVRYFWATRSFWARVLLCWLLGFILLTNDTQDQFDSRFQLRANVLKQSEIVLILLNSDDWNQFTSSKGGAENFIRPLKEIEEITDAYFWNEEAWKILLTKVLEKKPAAVGVSLFFGKNLIEKLNDRSDAVFSDPRLVWGARMDTESKINLSYFSSRLSAPSGLIDFIRDTDSVVRFTSSEYKVMNMGLKLAQKKKPQTVMAIDKKPINYMGPRDSFVTYNLNDLMSGTLSEGALQNKIVIIGAETPQHMELTPIGPMTRAEVLANMTDNYLLDHFIKKTDRFVYSLYLLLLLSFSLWVIYSYPQAIALTILCGMLLTISTFSIWLFDTCFYHLPVFAAFAQTVATFMIFLSFKLTTNERKTWQLEQERKYLKEVEELKNNFISLFSHDLKTPIAKIQAVVERRLATSSKDEDLTNDLLSLRQSNAVLHRYIQSILKLARVEAKDFTLKMDSIDINALIENVIQETQGLAQEKGQRIETDLEPLFSIECDSSLIQEVILNFVDNAIKYTPHGGRIIIHSKEIDDQVQVMVEDTGDGIDPEEQQKIWEKFYRLKKHDMNTAGTGIGLYLAKYFIELHGGQILLESTLGKGTRVGFILPIT